MLDNWEDLMADDAEVNFKKEGQAGFENEDLHVEKEQAYQFNPKTAEVDPISQTKISKKFVG